MEEFELRLPSVGDKVEITMSNVNWDIGMNMYVGHTFTIADVGYDGFVEFVPDENFPHLDVWSWAYHQGHFKILTEKKPLKIKLNF